MLILYVFFFTYFDDIFLTYLCLKNKLNPANSVSTPVNKQDIQGDGNEAAENLKTLAKLIFTNSEFRKILKDIGLLARDVAADGAAKAAETARPDEHQLRQVVCLQSPFVHSSFNELCLCQDEPAPDNQWVTKGSFESRCREEGAGQGQAWRAEEQNSR